MPLVGETAVGSQRCSAFPLRASPVPGDEAADELSRTVASASVQPGTRSALPHPQEICFILIFFLLSSFYFLFYVINIIFHILFSFPVILFYVPLYYYIMFFYIIKM